MSFCANVWLHFPQGLHRVMAFDAQEWNCRVMGHPSCNFEKQPDSFPLFSTFPPTVCEDSDFATSPPTLVGLWFWVF